MPYPKKLNCHFRQLLVVLFLLIFNTSSYATIWYVKPTASGSANGTSWANASANLKGIISGASAGDQIWVSAGSYTPPLGTSGPFTYYSFVLKEGVEIYGGFIGTETALSQRNFEANETKLVGNGNVVVKGDGLLTRSTRLDGFSILNGNATGNDIAGGLQLSTGSSPIIQHCKFYNNVSSIVGSGGGAISCTLNQTSPLIIDCIFYNNTAESGGAIYITYYSHPEIVNCSFYNNSATSGNGNAIYVKDKVATGNISAISNCVIYGNGSNEIFEETVGYLTVNYSNVKGGYAGTDNIDVNPNYINPSAGNLKLAYNSPCVQAGNNTAYNNVANINTNLDLSGNTRLSTNITNTGSTIDMGAYQYIVTAPSNLTYTSPNFFTVNVSSVNLTPTVSGTPTSVFSIDQPLPAGLTFNTTTGAITGIPSQLFSPTAFIVTTSNYVGTTTGTVHITVNEGLPNVNYTTPISYTIGQTLSPTLSPTNTGASVSGGLMSIPSSQSTGIINGNGMVKDNVGNLYIISENEKKIYKRSPAGVNSLYADMTSFPSLEAITIDVNTNILYVTTRLSVLKIQTDGSVTTLTQNGNLSYALGIILGSDGFLYVAEYQTDKIIKVDPSNGTQTVFATSLSPSNINYQGPTSLIFNREGNMIVFNGDATISMVTSAGVVTQRYYTPSDLFNFGGPRAVTMDAEGNLYVAGFKRSIKKINTIGDITTFAELPIMDHLLFGIQFGLNGELYVLYRGSALANSILYKFEIGKYQIQPTLPAGLSFDTNTGIISGTPTAIASATNYTIYATNGVGTVSSTINLEVKGTILYNTPNVFTKGTAIAALTPNTNGVTANTFSVSPALPIGLSIDAATGTISGTPTIISSQTEYTVTAVSTSGNLEGKLKITVNDVAPSDLIYTTPNVYTKGTSITNLNPSVNGGMVTNYAISPTLPVGLSMNASTGVISGTPTVLATSAVYTVTASNTGGSTSFGINITVNDVAPSNLSYASPQLYTIGTAIATLNPTISGGIVISYSVSPALPTGLSLNTSNGKITGTPTIVSPSATYTVTATNTGGSTSFGINITIMEVPVISNFNNLIKTYGDASFTISASSTSPGTITYASSNNNIATISNVGVVQIVNAGTVTITLNQTASGNYTSKSQSINLVVNKAPLDIISDTLYKIVGQADPQFTFTTGVNTFVYNDNASSLNGVIAREPAGETMGDYSTAINTLTSGNYIINFTPAKFIIKSNTILSLPDMTKTYGDDDFELLVQTNSPGNITYSSSDTSIVKISGLSANIATILKSGTVTITTTQGNSTYYLPASITTKITVNKAPLDIAAIPKTKRKRELDPILTYNIGNAGHGFIRNDDISALSGTLNRTAGETLGDYPINIGSLSSDKYYFNFTSANLTIVPNITRRYVIQDANGDGSSWANANGNIQAMIDSCYSGDSIWIAKGTYSRNQSYTMKEGVHLYGGFAGTEDSIQKRNWLQNEVIIQSSATNLPILNYQNASLTTILDGVTVKGNISNTNAIGIKTYNSNVNIINSKIVNNTSQNGAGLNIVSNTLNGNTINIFNCSFADNRTTIGGGAAILNKNNSVIIKNSLFNNNNAADNSAGAIVDSTNASISIFNSTFYRNNSSIGTDPLYMNPTNTIVNSIVMDSVENASNYSNVKYSLVPKGISGVGNKYFASNTFKDIFDSTSNNFTLAPRSIAIDAGDPQTNTASYAIQVGDKDLGIQNRIVWGKIDLGAYEYQSLKPADIVFADTATTFGNNDLELTANSNSNAPIVYSITDTTVAVVYQNASNHKWYVKSKDYGSVYIQAAVAQLDPYTSASKTILLTINPLIIRYSKDTAQCGNLIWNNITYDNSGTYSQLFKHIRAGVDSVATMYFTYKPIPPQPIITNKIKNIFSSTPAYYSSTINDYYFSKNFIYSHQICSNAVDSIELVSSDTYFNHWYLNDTLLSDTANSIKIKKAGRYKLEINWNGCTTSSIVDTVFNGSIVGSGLQIHDTLLCKASFLPIQAKAYWNGFDLEQQTFDSYFAATFNWTSKSKTFVNSISNAVLSLPDTYYVKINAVGCLVNDSIVVRNTNDTAIKARFTVSQQAFADQIVQAVSYTNPKPQQLIWGYPSNAILVQNQDTTLSLKFPSTTFSNRITLTAKSYDVCYSYDTAYIQIVTYDSTKLVNPKDVRIRNITIGPNPSSTGIFNVSVGLNIPGAISYGVWNIAGLNPIRPKVVSMNDKIVTFSVDLSNQLQGAYLLVVQTANSYEVRTLLNKY